MIRGMNLGNYLEAPIPGAWGVNIQTGFFKVIRSAGFNTVRIPVRFSAHSGENSPYQIDPVFLSEVDRNVHAALDDGLSVILDLHNFDELMRDPVGQRTRYLVIWQQLSEHYQTAPPALYFELLNEPNQQMNGVFWNDLLKDAILLIRQKNPQRVILIGGPVLNSIAGLDELKLPPDDHLAAIFHFYEPFEFTHQGAAWVQGSSHWIGKSWTGSDDEKKLISDRLEQAARWSQKNQIPIVMDEFGAITQADVQSRVKWTAFVAQKAEEFKIGWVYWEFCSEFKVYDCKNGLWDSELLKALIPE